MLVLTAPSKTQRLCLETLPDAFMPLSTPQFMRESVLLTTELKKLNPTALSQLMKLSAKLTASTGERIAAFSPPFTRQNASPALLTFQGDAWESVNAASYTAEEVDHAESCLRILSGLYGILRPRDLMQPYRLEMGLKFAPQGAGNLYDFWRQKITAALLAELTTAAARKQEQSIINLASAEYAKAVDKKRLTAAGCRWLDITFQQPHPKSSSGWKTIPIHSKRARGMMIDDIIKKRKTAADDLRAFTRGGYRFVEKESTENSWLFRRLEE